MFQKLNNVLSKILLLVCVTLSGLLLVSVTVSGLLVISTCASLVVGWFKSYPASFIINLLIASTSLSNLTRLSLVKIAFVFFFLKWNYD